MFDLLRKGNYFSASDSFLLSRYNLGTWVPSHDPSLSKIFTMIIMMEEVTEVDIALHFGHDFDFLEELSDYYCLVRLLMTVEHIKLESQNPIVFSVNPLEVIKAISKSVRFGVDDEKASIMQHYYLSLISKPLYTYKYVKPHNIFYYLIAINIVKGLIRYWRSYKLHSEYDLIKYLREFLKLYTDRTVFKWLSQNSINEVRVLISDSIERFLLK